jgi:hypothetical protein
MGGSSKGGSSGSTSSTKISPLEQSLADISKEMYATTSPLRSSLIDKYSSVLGGNYDYKSDPTYSPLFQSAKQGIEGQYGTARQNILSSTPAGGGLTKALSNLDIARAGDMATVPANLQSQIANSLLGNATSAAWNTPQTSIASLGSANNSYASRLMQQQAISAQGKTGLGQGIGNLAGTAMMAAALA